MSTTAITTNPNLAAAFKDHPMDAPTAIKIITRPIEFSGDREPTIVTLPGTDKHSPVKQIHGMVQVTIEALRKQIVNLGNTLLPLKGSSEKTTLAKAYAQNLEIEDEDNITLTFRRAHILLEAMQRREEMISNPVGVLARLLSE